MRGTIVQTASPEASGGEFKWSSVTERGSISIEGTRWKRGA
jgi:hypothetical protein